MKPRDLVELVALAAIWGAAFLFMRISVGEFGPIALVLVRVGGATLLLFPLLAWHGHTGALRAHWRAIGAVGLVNSMLPFIGYGVAALALSAGLMSIFNAATPLWTALIGLLWLRERLTRLRLLGLVIGFAGVLWLAWDTASLKPNEHGVSAALAIAACLLATLCYGVSANMTRKRLGGVPPLAIATGSQLAATLAMLLPAWATWPVASPSGTAWAAAIALATVSSGLAYVLYFRLIAHVGAVNASAVTFLMPLFAVLFGVVILGESVTATMVAGCLVILAGTGLATGLVKAPVRAEVHASSEDRR
ncbi:MAG: DMT family transporter [Betaproteobacteria bacterium]|nr:DMT family transporter [Betaproteobacteria bacterium]